MSEELTIAPVGTPRSLDADDAADFRDLADVITRGLAHDLRRDHLTWIASEMLPAWQDQTYRVHGGLLARRAGVAVGGLAYTGPGEEGARELEFDVMAAPEAREAGVESALFAAFVEVARALGRPVLQVYSIHRSPVTGPRMSAPTGFGAIPIDAQTRFFLDHGFTLQQVDRNSLYDLLAEPVAARAMLEGALAHAGPEYRVVTWSAPTPPAYADGIADVVSRMSTDAPSAGLEWTAESWDAARVRARDERLAAGGITNSIAAVVHEPTGRLVAYNELGIGADRSRPTSQWGTLVLREHRGHRLGTIVKCANILRWRELVPDSPSISTFNAEENRPMLDVNEAVGFTEVAVGGAWQRVLE